MNILILGGSGIQGSAVALDMLKKENIKVTIAGRRRETLQRIFSWLQSEKLKIEPVDVSDRNSLVQLIKEGKFDIVICSVPRALLKNWALRPDE